MEQDTFPPILPVAIIFSVIFTLIFQFFIVMKKKRSEKRKREKKIMTEYLTAFKDRCAEKTDSITYEFNKLQETVHEVNETRRMNMQTLKELQEDVAGQMKDMQEITSLLTSVASTLKSD